MISHTNKDITSSLKAFEPLTPGQKIKTSAASRFLKPLKSFLLNASIKCADVLDTHNVCLPAHFWTPLSSAWFCPLQTYAAYGAPCFLWHHVSHSLGTLQRGYLSPLTFRSSSCKDTVVRHEPIVKLVFSGGNYHSTPF